MTPRTAEVKFLLERAALRGRLGREAGFLADMGRLLRLEPRNRTALAWRARWLARRGRRAEALAALDRLIRRHGSAAGYECFVLRAGLLLLKGEGPRGWRDLLKAYAIEPRFMAAYAEGVEASSRKRRTPIAGGVADCAGLDRAAEAWTRRAPRSAAAWAWRGLLRRRALDYAGAASDLDRAWGLGLRSAMVLTWRGEARLQSGDPRGMDDMTAALRRPAQAWNHAWCGRAKVAFARDPRALACFDRAIKLEPGNGWHYAWRAEAKRILGRTRGMLEDFDRALRTDPGYDYQAWVLGWRGMALLRLGRAEEALADFDLSLSEKPGYPLALHGRAQALRALGLFPRWFDDFRRALTSDAKYLQAQFSRSREELRALVADLGKIKRPEALAWRGLFLNLMGNRARALETLERAVGADPKDAWARAFRGLARGAGEGASADLDRAVRRSPRNPLFRVWRAKLHVAAGRARRALRDYDRALAADQRHAWIFGERGRLRLLTGDARGAAQDLRQALRLDRRDADSAVDLAAALRKAGQGRAADEALGLARSIDPSRAERRLTAWTRP